MAKHVKHNFTGDLTMSKDTTEHGHIFYIKPSDPKNLKKGYTIRIQDQMFYVAKYDMGIGTLHPVGNMNKLMRIGKVFIDLEFVPVEDQPVFNKPAFDIPIHTAGLVIAGWICIQCGTSNSPWMPTCGNMFCTPPTTATNTTGTKLNT